MKAKWTFALAIVLLASFAALAQDSESFYPIPAEPTPIIDSFTQSCLNFCARVYCASGSCGVYTDKNGQRACGCHDSTGISVNQNQIAEP